MNDPDIDTLARTLWGEARGEGVAGMEAIAHVVLNRKAVADQEGGYWWGSTIEDVCKHPFQYTCWNSNDTNRGKLARLLPTDRVFSQALEIAADAVDGVFVSDPTNGATHYLNPSGVNILPKWARGKPLAIIGKHHFFRPPEVPALRRPDIAITATPPAFRLSSVLGKFMHLFKT